MAATVENREIVSAFPAEKEMNGTPVRPKSAPAKKKTTVSTVKKIF